MATDLDHCPTCGKRIKDFDEGGCESSYGQRFCLVHFPAGGLGPEDAELDIAACVWRTQVETMSALSIVIINKMVEEGDADKVELVSEYVDSLLASARVRYPTIMSDDDVMRKFRDSVIRVTVGAILTVDGRVN